MKRADDQRRPLRSAASSIVAYRSRLCAAACAGASPRMRCSAASIAACASLARTTPVRARRERVADIQMRGQRRAAQQQCRANRRASCRRYRRAPSIAGRSRPRTSGTPAAPDTTPTPPPETCSRETAAAFRRSTSCLPGNTHIISPAIRRFASSCMIRFASLRFSRWMNTVPSCCASQPTTGQLRISAFETNGVGRHALIT